MKKYTLNTDAARASESTGTRLNETGQYIGKFTRAEAVTSRSGTEGVEFSFESNDGKTCDYLTLWTHKENGEEVFGFKLLNAIMTCLKLRNISAVDSSVEKFDKAEGKKVTSPAVIFPDLMGKPIGLLLQREEYQKGDGSTGSKMNIFASFSAQTSLMASEILDGKTSPEKLSKVAASLKDRIAKPANNSHAQNGAYGNQPPSYDEDIGF